MDALTQVNKSYLSHNIQIIIVFIFLCIYATRSFLITLCHTDTSFPHAPLFKFILTTKKWAVSGDLCTALWSILAKLQLFMLIVSQDVSDQAALDLKMFWQ